MTKPPPSTLAKIMANLTRPIPAPYRPPPPPPKPPKAKTPKPRKPRKAKKVVDQPEGSD